jgi:hypothetical protein
MARVTVASPVTPVAWGVELDGAAVVTRNGGRIHPVRIDTRRLSDGVHRLRVSVRDMAGNVGTRTWAIRVDNTAPRIRLARVVAPRGRPAARPRPVRLAVRVDDRGSLRPLELTARIVGGPAPGRPLRVRPGTARTVTLPVTRRGRITVRIEARDAAGNRHVVLRRAIIR